MFPLSPSFHLVRCLLNLPPVYHCHAYSTYLCMHPPPFSSFLHHASFQASTAPSEWYRPLLLPPSRPILTRRVSSTRLLAPEGPIAIASAWMATPTHITVPPTWFLLPRPTRHAQVGLGWAEAEAGSSTSPPTSFPRRCINIGNIITLGWRPGQWTPDTTSSTIIEIILSRPAITAATT